MSHTHPQHKNPTIHLTHTHTHTHTHIYIYPRAASISQGKNINKALIIKYIQSFKPSIMVFINQGDQSSYSKMHVHIHMHNLPHCTITHQRLCINVCSSSYTCLCDSSKTQILIINSTIKACETCYSIDIKAKHVKTRLNMT